MELRTKRGLIAGVADAWRAQYRSQEYSDRGGIERIYRQLRELPDDATEADVATIIGNSSWTRNECDECEQDVAVTVQVGASLGYESSTAHVCPDCLRAALKLAAA